MKKIKRIAKKFLKDINYDLNWLNVKHYCEQLGFKIHIFNENFLEDDIINSFKIELNYDEKGFVYDSLNYKFILIRNNLDEFNKLRTLLHELAHIILNHKYSLLKIEAQEQEADEFAIQVLKASEHTFSTRNFALIIASVLCIVFSLIFSYNDYNINTEATDAEPHIENNLINVSDYKQSDTVFITKSGSCYHTLNCFYIRNSNAIPISLSEAQKSYRPCKLCIK